MANDNGAIVASNPWAALRRFTPARIALGRAGTSLPTVPHLAFQLAHARARNAVNHELDTAALVGALQSRGLPYLQLHSEAGSRPEYLQRPDKGRRLDAKSRAQLQHLKREHAYDVVFVIGDGLSALAIDSNAVAFLDALLPSLNAAGWKIAPVAVVEQARVAIGDEIGEILATTLSVVLIGERPGLSSPDSLGLYLTHQPRVGMTDESRNCISNVRSEGLSYEQAAHKLFYLMNEARRRGVSGVNLKDDAEALPQSLPLSRRNFLITGD